MNRSLRVRTHNLLASLFPNVFSDIPYDSLEKALEGDRTKSEFYTLLNGEWDFRYFERDIDCPEKIEAWDKVS
jgi:hypothetical protein